MKSKFYRIGTQYYAQDSKGLLYARVLPTLWAEVHRSMFGEIETWGLPVSKLERIYYRMNDWRKHLL